MVRAGGAFLFRLPHIITTAILHPLPLRAFGRVAREHVRASSDFDCEDIFFHSSCAHGILSHRYPEEALTRTQALRGMTCDPAYAAFAEDTLGRLAPGFAADFVVLDRDIMRIPLEEILGTKVLATVVDGQVAYGNL